jgi:hypothetical protein
MNYRAIVWRDAILIKTGERDPLVESIPCARWIPGRGFYTFPLSLFMARRLNKRLAPEWLGDDVGRSYLLEWGERYELAKRMRDAEELPDVPVDGKTPSWKHQKRGFWFSYHSIAAALSEGMGVGKSKQIIALIESRDHKISLVVTTASCVEDWPGHVEKNAAGPLDVCALVKGTSQAKAERIVAAVAAARASGRRLLIAVSYDSVWRDEIAAAILEAGLDLVVLDESHNIGDPRSKRTKFLVYRLAPRVKFRVCASGTMAKHKPEDLFAQFLFLDPGIVGNSFKEFQKRYCVFNRPADEELREKVKVAKERLDAAVAANDPQAILDRMRDLNIETGTLAKLSAVPRFVVGYQRLDELHSIFRAVSFHCESDVLDLPEPVHVTRRCVLSDRLRKAYRQLEEEFATEIAGVEIPPSIAMVRILKLQQMTSGFVSEMIYDPESGELIDTIPHDVDDAKADALREILTEIDPDEPVVVCARFKFDLVKIARVARELGRNYFEQSGAKKQKAEFVASIGGDVLGGQIKSASEGNDFTRSHYCVLYSIGHSLYQYEQMLKRIDRPGQTRPPCFIHIIAEKSVDEKVYKALKARKDIVETVTNGYRAGSTPSKHSVARP